ncbi:hypothetical protein VOLCADRAFT_106879 [Volvox carteri f. nagariensis]|uniref:Beta'-coat protein n=1 Tax=Volvox carteri f. nagariensis TaxID=3068 RepID=D8UAE2_VOLCA|nr:uncharacterized protein VOLCADRAFT_106879 [Volvox carteri f. nagariensis]EFJ43300.1 hypothetical protein VOLCADRAFT_106879 [Volvox carteri f. nagariensis]|eukprot:XP_002955660.1 hypothetical protein VOLCADRAFT_106879 [Volvox carteri f. nagariensis]
MATANLNRYHENIFRRSCAPSVQRQFGLVRPVFFRSCMARRKALTRTGTVIRAELQDPLRNAQAAVNTFLRRYDITSTGIGAMIVTGYCVYAHDQDPFTALGITFTATIIALKQLVQRTDRVKGVDVHPTEPWILANLYNGNVYIWNYMDQTLVKSFEVTELPVRASKFVARKQWVITGSDDMFIRVYNYNTMDKVKTFEAHTDYIRCIAISPTMPYILTSSDDMLIKLWDWEKLPLHDLQGWNCVQVFEGHSHYVMQVSFNPKDTNTFASASLDRTIKVWSLGQPTPNFTLEGHEKGVNCVDYFTGGDRPYLISGADDRLVKVWDYQTKACVTTLEGHAHNISSAIFHPELPIIVTGSEDGTVKLWHSTTYRLENTLDHRMERVWSLGYCKGSNCIAIGYDEGVVMLKIGRDEPVASMDNSGKIIWARHNEIQTVNIKALGADFEMVDGERLPLPVKDLGSCDLYPQSLQHNPNGRFVVVCGDGEYIVYTALAWRNKAFGSGLEFVWSADSSDYAIRESPSKIKIYKNFQEKHSVSLGFNAEGIHGGTLVSVRGSDFIVFYDWEGRVVRRIDVAAKSVHWSESGNTVAILGDSSFYILKYNKELVEEHFASGTAAGDDGVDDAFDLQAEVSERVRTCVWVGECFVYNNTAWRLNYCVGGEVTTVVHLDRPMYLLGYLAAQNRVFLIDKEFNIVSYTLLLSLIEFKARITAGELDSAMELLPSIPQVCGLRCVITDQHNSVARFLEAKGMLSTALQVATDQDYRFDLAVQLGDLEVAQEIAVTLDSTAKWKQLGEMALTAGKLDLAAECLTRASDFSGLLMLAAARGDRTGMAAVAAAATAGGKTNVAFLASFLLGRLEDCLSLLLESHRLPEAAFFARTYLPSSISPALVKWKADLAAINPKAAEALADPAAYPNLFPHLEEALRAEKLLGQQRSNPVPASAYLDAVAVTAGSVEGGIERLLERLQVSECEEAEAMQEEAVEEEELMEEAEEAGEDDASVEVEAEAEEEPPALAPPPATAATPESSETEPAAEAGVEDEDEDPFGDPAGDGVPDAGNVAAEDLDDDWGLDGDGDGEA